MYDRISQYQGRVTLKPVKGQENVYDMTLSDSPTQEGTPLNKATLLKDDTATSLDLGVDATPDDALKKIISRTGDLDKKITYGTTELVAGSSSLKTGVLYVVYE